MKVSKTKAINLDAEIIDSIELVKQQIQDKERMPLNQHCLTFEGKYLKYYSILQDLNIRRESTLKLFISST